MQFNLYYEPPDVPLSLAVTRCFIVTVLIPYKYRQFVLAYIPIALFSCCFGTVFHTDTFIALLSHKATRKRALEI
jgi:glycerol uptake facilitator-like aquaporin